ncbi:DUF4192 domain-containing protein [Streptomyces sp. NPDC059037]|uniref:DUF4192 domain-containing protein n=1 Tax=Streptomyces sp. NPDC059037 TaxID=3346710 RepID=UPI0036AD4289
MTASDPRIKIDGPAGFAEIMPYLIGYRPEDTIVLHGVIATGFGTGPTMTLPLPEDPATWEAVAEAFAPHFLHVTQGRGQHDIQDIVVFLCRTPRPGQTAEETAELLMHLADCFADIFDDLGLAPVRHTIGLVGNRWWGYECDLPGCCEGEPLPSPDDPNSVTAQLARLGRTVARSSSDVASEYRPTTTNAARYRAALEDVAADIEEQTQTRLGQLLTRDNTTKIISGALKDFHNGNPQLMDETAARIIIGLQDPRARDNALVYGEGDDLPIARQLWAYLARRCVPPHSRMALPLLTLLSWVAWRQDDIVTARHAIKEALTIGPTYLMADLLHDAMNSRTDRDGLLTRIRAANHRQVEEDQADIHTG